MKETLVKTGVLHVAVIDDDESVRESTAGWLRSKGYTTSVFSDARTFQGQLDANQCDFVVTDHNMPGMTGIELLRHIRSKPGFEELPVVVYSARDIRFQVERAGGIYADKANPWGSLFPAIENAENMARAK